MTGTCLGDRAIIRVGGEEARGFLQGLVTQDVLGLTPSAPRWSALLTPQGKVLFDFILWAEDACSDVLIDVEASAADALIRRLSIYRLRRAVTIAAQDKLAVHWALDAAAETPRDPRMAALGHRWLAAADSGDASAAFRAHRLSLGVTEGQAELGTDQTLWLEANARELNGVDFTKGCYVGQENTARMHYRAKISRRLVVVPLVQSDPARQRVALPDLGLAIDHRRVEDMHDLPLADWQRAAITADAGQTP